MSKSLTRPRPLGTVKSVMSLRYGDIIIANVYADDSLSREKEPITVKRLKVTKEYLFVNDNLRYDRIARVLIKPEPN